MNKFFYYVGSSGWLVALLLAFGLITLSFAHSHQIRDLQTKIFTLEGELKATSEQNETRFHLSKKDVLLIDRSIVELKNEVNSMDKKLDKIIEKKLLLEVKKALKVKR